MEVSKAIFVFELRTSVNRNKNLTAIFLNDTLSYDLCYKFTLTDKCIKYSN